MSENYIRNHFDDIKKYASVIEDRMDDEWCTLDSVLKDNAEMMRLAKAHGVNCAVIDEKDEIVGHVGIMPFDVLDGNNGVIRMAGIASVGTDPDYRGRGIAASKSFPSMVAPIMQISGL